MSFRTLSRGESMTLLMTLMIPCPWTAIQQISSRCVQAGKAFIRPLWFLSVHLTHLARRSAAAAQLLLGHSPSHSPLILEADVGALLHFVLDPSAGGKGTTAMPLSPCLHELTACSWWQVFAPAFRRNTRWSVAQPVPEVGDESTPYANVDKFYDFWFGFKSWREFPHPDEEDTEQAESREERR